MGRPLRIAALQGAAAVTFALLAGCSREADPARAVGPAVELPGQTLPDPDPKPDPDPVPIAPVPPPRWATGEDAAAFMGNVAALDRIRARMRSAAALQAPRITAFTTGFRTGFAGNKTAAPAFPAQPADRSEAAFQAASLEAWNALGALGGAPGGPMGSLASGLSVAPFRVRGADIPAGASASGADDQPFHNHISFDGDTSWFVYDDSAQGRVHWIHAFHDADGNTYGLVRDSLVYRWPFPPPAAGGAPVLTASHSRVLRFDGVVFESGLSDGDGDGYLNGPPGTGLLRRKLSVVAVGDSAWKSEWLLESGAIDPSGEGAIVAFCDTLFVRGVAVAGTRSFDGDGDGLAFGAPPGSPMAVRIEAFRVDADGLRIHTDGAYGQGADGDYFAAGDNPLYPFSVAVLTAAGDTLSVHAYGDADADGYYADPASGAVNRVRETGRYLEREDCESYRDSLVKTLGGLGDPGDDRVAFYGAHAVRRDGGGTHRIYRADGPEWTREERRYAPDGDSTVASAGVRADGTVTYADLLAGGARASGAYDPVTGRFRDTLASAPETEAPDKAVGGAKRAYEFCEGVYRAADGTGDFTWNFRPAGGAGSWTRMILAADGPGGFAVTAIHEPDREAYSIRGDTVTWMAKYGDTLAAFEAIAKPETFSALPAFPVFTGFIGFSGFTGIADLVPGDGGYRLLESVSDGEGRMLAEADFRFGPDLAGRGMFRDLTVKPVSPVEILFSAGGSARVEEAPGALQTR